MQQCWGAALEHELPKSSRGRHVQLEEPEEPGRRFGASRCDAPPAAQYPGDPPMGSELPAPEHLQKGSGSCVSKALRVEFSRPPPRLEPAPLARVPRLSAGPLLPRALILLLLPLTALISSKCTRPPPSLAAGGAGGCGRALSDCRGGREERSAGARRTALTSRRSS